LNDHALSISDFERRQCRIHGVDRLELLNGKSLKTRRITSLHGADEIGMTRDDFGIDVHAVANPVQGLKTDKPHRTGFLPRGLQPRTLQPQLRRPGLSEI
jgi:hypothetical protein